MLMKNKKVNICMAAFEKRNIWKSKMLHHLHLVWKIKINNILHHVRSLDSFYLQKEWLVHKKKHNIQLIWNKIEHSLTFRSLQKNN